VQDALITASLMIALHALIAFVSEHRRCGDLDGGRDGGYIWLACSCGAQIMRPGYRASPSTGTNVTPPIG